LNDAKHPVKDIVSEITGKQYNPSDCVYIKNPVQTARYLKHKLPLLDLIVSDDDKLVFIFNRELSRESYELWLRHELV
jgi:hypothetical protein